MKEAIRTTLNVWIVEANIPHFLRRWLAVIEWNMRCKEDRY